MNAFVSSLLEVGAGAATARSRQLAVRRFSAWLTEEGEIAADQLANLKPPQLDHKVVQELDDGQCRLLIKKCPGRGLPRPPRRGDCPADDRDRRAGR